MSFYCSDELTGLKDLAKIYFKDINDQIYYQVMTQGPNSIGNTIRTCSDNTKIQISTVNIKAISVPSNAYAYVYKTSSITKLAYSLFGSYYTDNIIDVTGDATHPYDDEKFMFYYSTVDERFIENCRCGLPGTSSSICGDTFNKPSGPDDPLNCQSVVNVTPAFIKEDPSKRIKGAILTWVWIVLAFVAFVIVIAIIFGALIIFGVFKSKDKGLDGIGNNPALVTSGPAYAGMAQPLPDTSGPGYAGMAQPLPDTSGPGYAGMTQPLPPTSGPATPGMTQPLPATSGPYFQGSRDAFGS
jgi:hypothetical protein